MKIKTYKLEATIPCGQYANLQPSVEIETDSIDKAQKVAMEHIQGMFDKYSDITLKDTAPQISETVKLKSFNEDCVVEFDPSPTAHTYFYNKDKFESGSVYASKFYKKFDAKAVSKNCEKPWGVKAQDIQDMWASNAKVATDFGTIVHQTLEHYFKYKSIANTISVKRDDDVDRAMPKHPLLKTIIEEFIKIDNFTGEVLTEVFVTDKKNKRCGQIDRLLILDKEKKVCRVQDYKINISAEKEDANMKAMEPYDELPPNKLTKYQIQLSFYADILKQTGWTVTGLDSFVLEDGWKHYEQELLAIE